MWMLETSWQTSSKLSICCRNRVRSKRLGEMHHSSLRAPPWLLLVTAFGTFGATVSTVIPNRCYATKGKHRSHETYIDILLFDWWSNSPTRKKAMLSLSPAACQNQNILVCLLGITGGSQGFQKQCSPTGAISPFASYTKLGRTVMIAKFDHVVSIPVTWHVFPVKRRCACQGPRRHVDLCE